MLFVKKTVRVPQPPVVQETRVVQPVVQPQRTVVVEQPNLSQGTIALIILGFLTVVGLALYFWWYRPAYVEVATPPTVIHDTKVVTPSNPPSSSTVIVHEPPVVMPAPQIKVNNQPPVHVEGTGGADVPLGTGSGSANGTTSSGSDDTPPDTSGAGAGSGTSGGQ